jgi:protein TonB
MRRDLIIGIILSIILHGGVAMIGKAPPKPVHKEAEAPTVELMKMPDIEPEEIQKTEDQNEPQAPVDFAPPMQTDVPQVVQLDSFVQQVQPPPPEGMKPNVGIISIPTGNRSSLGKGIEIFDPSKLDQQPQGRVQGKPVYPFEMQRAGIAGDVLVEFIIDANGDVRNPFVVKSSQREFEAAAIQAVSKWKFRPGKKGGRAVNTRVQQVIGFTLNDQ